MFTLALGVILTISIERWESVTGGTDGLIGIPPPAAIGPIAFTSLVAQYYLVLVFLALTIYVSVSIAQSLVGRSFIAIAEREPGARHRHRCWPDDEAVVCDLGDVCRAGPAAHGCRRMRNVATEGFTKDVTDVIMESLTIGSLA